MAACWSGGLADGLGRRNLAWYALIPAIGLFLASPLYLVTFTQISLGLNIALLGLAGICLVFHYGPGIAIIQNLASARSRASTIAIYSLVVNAISLAMAPVFVGGLSDLFTAMEMTRHPGRVCAAGDASGACLEVMGIGLRHALLATIPLYLWGGVHYLLAARAMKRSEQTA